VIQTTGSGNATKELCRELAKVVVQKPILSKPIISQKKNKLRWQILIIETGKGFRSQRQKDIRCMPTGINILIWRYQRNDMLRLKIELELANFWTFLF
jgi:hypothetical protein